MLEKAPPISPMDPSRTYQASVKNEHYYVAPSPLCSPLIDNIPYKTCYTVSPSHKEARENTNPNVIIPKQSQQQHARHCEIHVSIVFPLLKPTEKILGITHNGEQNHKPSEQKRKK